MRNYVKEEEQYGVPLICWGTIGLEAISDIIKRRRKFFLRSLSFTLSLTHTLSFSNEHEFIRKQWGNNALFEATDRTRLLQRSNKFEIMAVGSGKDPTALGRSGKIAVGI